MSASNTDRRAIIGAGALIAGAGVLASSACAQDTSGKGWSPTADEQDAWLDKPNTRHRMAFDTTSFEAASTGAHFANNFYLANKSGYGLESEALGVVLILRAEATPFAYNDSIWAKYGQTFINFMKLEGDVAKRSKESNPLYSGAAVTLAMLQEKGARFAVCGMATHGISGMLARGAGKPHEEVESDIKANLIPGAMMVPAGIVAVNRAQEHGYAFAYVQG